MSISFPASRAMSAATLTYGVYALAKPSHLADAMKSDSSDRAWYDSLAKAYGVRDLVVSLLGIFGPGRAVAWAMRGRIAGDLADCATLVTKADDGKVRGKVAAVTIGWAVLNFVAYRWDRSRA